MPVISRRWRPEWMIIISRRKRIVLPLSTFTAQKQHKLPVFLSPQSVLRKIPINFLRIGTGG
jgi:hypothetical protein